ncbi:hypothetical protein RRG08_019074 [Elysia crispata]|uniref:Uncharacterized protein n=1 Tax=Elysia crispata TaxID=231223 RepID=A0AAE1A506_9GAST|nr:hypothetical protein RRG08_019074 [Elysia crispata]
MSGLENSCKGISVKLEGVDEWIKDDAKRFRLHQKSGSASSEFIEYFHRAASSPPSLAVFPAAGNDRVCCIK